MTPDTQAKYLLSDKYHFTKIEQMMKWCSKAGDIFSYPYFFNWSPPTNHRDNTPEGEIQDVDYVILRVGKYISQEYVEGDIVSEGRKLPVEIQIWFGLVDSVLRFLPLSYLIDETGNKIKTWVDVVGNRDELITKIDEMFEGKI